MHAWCCRVIWKSFYELRALPLDRRRDRARPGRGWPAGAALRLRPQGQREDGAELPARHACLQRRGTHERELAEIHRWPIWNVGKKYPLLVQYSFRFWMCWRSRGASSCSTSPRCPASRASPAPATSGTSSSTPWSRDTARTNRDEKYKTINTGRMRLYLHSSHPFRNEINWLCVNFYIHGSSYR